MSNRLSLRVDKLFEGPVTSLFRIEPLLSITRIVWEDRTRGGAAFSGAGLVPGRRLMADGGEAGLAAKLLLFKAR